MQGAGLLSAVTYVVGGGPGAGHSISVPGSARGSPQGSHLLLDEVGVMLEPRPHEVMQMALNTTHMEPRAELAPCRGSVSASCPLAPLPVPGTYPLADWKEPVSASVSVLYL